MTDLFSLSQIIKNLALYKIHRDEIHRIYYHLGRSQNLTVEQIKKSLQSQLPEVFWSLLVGESLFDSLLKIHSQQLMQGVQFVVYGHELYPASCYLMADPPLCLSFLGAPAWLAERSLSVVGSREPSAESLRWMESELSQFCETERALIVSGGARGVDQKAHGVALRKGCPTVVVLPSGLGELYPSSLQDWVRPVLDGGGCFVSEYDFGQKMHKHLFHHRNRLIAALGAVTLLVEAKRRSGTLITAHQAAQMGRAVCVVPGHPQDPHFAGCLDLLSEGAIMIRDAQDLSMFFHSELRSEKVATAGVV